MDVGLHNRLGPPEDDGPLQPHNDESACAFCEPCRRRFLARHDMPNRSEDRSSGDVHAFGTAARLA